MSYVFEQRPEDSKFWLRAFDWKYRNKGSPITRSEWDSVLGDCDAVSDFPCAAFSEELIAAYPEAKVILTVRDTPDVWLRSAMQTVWYVHLQSPFAPHKILGQPIFEPMLPSLFRMGKRMFSDVFDANLPETGIDVYNDHIRRLTQLLPQERLLVFNVKQGWKPLCDFLDVQVPGRVGFPRVNEGQAVVEKVLAKQAVLRRMIRLLFCGMALTIAAITLSLL